MMVLKNLWNSFVYATATLLVFCSVAKADVVINIDKTNQNMTVFVNGIETYEWLVSTGTYGYDTPNGDYYVTGMHEVWYSRTYDDAPMPHSVFFTNSGHAIHGTTEVGTLGLPASHGCVRLHPDNAVILFDLIQNEGQEETRIVVSGHIGTVTAEQDRPRSKAEVAPVPPVLNEPPVIVIEPPVIVIPEYRKPPRWLRRQWRREYRDFRRYGW